MDHNHEVVSFSANKKWFSIPEDMRKKIQKNVWCSNCGDVVQIENFIVKESQAGLVLHGKCNRCGHNVVRVVE